MSVILEFTIGGNEFMLGQVLSPPPDMRFDLERIVSTGHVVTPYVWATGDDHAAFEKKVRQHPAVEDLLVLDKIDDHGLYRLGWENPPEDLIVGITEADAIVLEAGGNENWVFRLRFPNHDTLSRFHNFVIDHDIPIHIERTYTLTESTERGHRFNLTQEQRKALVLALQRGYFETPSAVGLQELADELGITRQALSNRIRRSNEKVLHSVLLLSVTDFDQQ